MTASFRLRPGEFNRSFFDQLHALIQDREVELVVYEPENDGSDYPFNNPLQTQYLRESLDRVDRGEGLVSVSIEELRKQHS